MISKVTAHRLPLHPAAVLMPNAVWWRHFWLCSL